MQKTKTNLKNTIK